MLLKVAILLCLCTTSLGLRVTTVGRSLLASSRAQSRADASSSGAGNSASASASASVSARGGTARASVSATADAFAEAEDAFAEAVVSAIASIENGGSSRAEAIAAAEALATAVAEAFTSVTIEVFSDSEDSEICANGSAEASATATATARVLVEVLAEASNFIRFASAEAAIEAVASATASAFAESEASICGRGRGGGTAIQENLATAIAQPYIQVCLAAFANVAARNARASIVVDAVIDIIEETNAETFSIVAVNGDFDGAASGDATAETREERVVPSNTSFCSTIRFGDCCDDDAERCSCAFGSSICRAERFYTNGKIGYEVVATNRGVGPQVGDLCICR